jgi:hypothetical protein
MNDNIIAWTPTNWVTVILMVGTGFVILGAVARFVREHNAKG